MIIKLIASDLIADPRDREQVWRILQRTSDARSGSEENEIKDDGEENFETRWRYQESMKYENMTQITNYGRH